MEEKEKRILLSAELKENESCNTTVELDNVDAAETMACVVCLLVRLIRIVKQPDGAWMAAVLLALAEAAEHDDQEGEE